MAVFKNYRTRLGGDADRFDRVKPVVYRYVFGEEGEFGSVTFRRTGNQTEILETIEPEQGDQLRKQSESPVAVEPAGDDGPDVAR